MEDKMESEHSYSGESSSSSDSSSRSSVDEVETMEPVRVLGHCLELPQELCEDYSVFKEFFSMKTWENLEDKHREQLMEYLPKFTANDEEEKQKTIKMLFSHEPFHFTSPLSDFYNNLKQGNYRPDIAKMRKYLMNARAKQQRHKIKSYYAKLLPEVLISRERLLAVAKASPPGLIPSLPILPPKPPKNNYKPVYVRARQRYFEELAAIRSEVGGEMSDDENYPEGPPEQARKKKQINPPLTEDGNISGTLGGSDQPFPNSLERLKNVLASHRIRRQYRENHPELNTTGITLDDIKQRVTLVNGAKKLMFGGQKASSPVQKVKRGPRKDSNHKPSKGNDKIVVKKGKDDTESVETKPLLSNIKIKSEPMESDSENSTFVDPVSSPKHLKKAMEHVQIKQEVVDTKYSHTMNNVNYNDSKLECVVKQEPQDSAMASSQNSRVNQPVPIKLEDLDGIDMMALPVELADDSGEVIQVETSTENADESTIDVDESLTETTHANFLSLVRALFPARAAHRASKQELHARCAAVMKSAIAPLNTWYNLSDDWCAELDSALDFLAGERGAHPDDFVPYLQFIPESQMYQWIGAGRDCDAILGRLCERWLRSASPTPSTSEPPPPRYPTSWVVRAPTSVEIADFWAQERRRFSSAAKPFTYVQYGYRSVVGPCARWWGAGGAAAAVGGAAAVSLLATARPRHAVFAALVRDAVARLPNGEGTRHDVLTLLKMSQWILPSNDQALLSAVSTTLEKLQSAKRDPIVKCDQRTAVWTYLHRHRTEEDWAKTTGKGRNSKVNVNQTVAVTKTPPVLPPLYPTTTNAVSTTKDVSSKEIPAHCLEVEVGTVEEVVEASDSDVDVDDSGTTCSVPHLSSAQLLMQATQSQTKPSLPQKPKGKLVATPPAKPKAQTKPTKANKQANLMTQSVKQANLLAQSVKQTVTTQAAKSQPKANIVTQSPKSETSTTKINTKQNLVASPQVVKQNVSKQTTSPTKTINMKPVQITKANITQLVKQSGTQSVSTQQSVSQSISGKAIVSPSVSAIQGISQSTCIQSVSASVSNKQTISLPVAGKQSITQSVSGKQSVSQAVTNLAQVSAQLSKSLPSVVTPSQKSPLIKQRPLLKTDTSQSLTVSQQVTQPTTIVSQPTTITILQNQSKIIQGTRSLLIRPPVVQTTVTAVVTTSTTQVTHASRRGVVRVLSPATPSSGKSLISPRALMQSNTQTTKKRASVTNTSSVTTVAQSTASTTAVVSSVPTVVSSSVATRTVQLASGRTVQLANQTVHLPSGQAVQLSSGHTLQLSSLQLPTHSVRLPSGQTVQLATPQSLQTVRLPTTIKTPSSRPQTTPIVKNIQTTQSTVQIPVSTVQLAGQTVQIAGQTVQLAGQSVQLTGHTVKLPSGQSVQVAGQSVLQSQSVQLPSGQTVQLAGNLQTLQLGASNLQLSTQSGQSVQLGQTVQLAGQTVQLGGQTVQLSGGQTIQLSSGQTLQLASGQTVQLANQTAKPITHVVRSQTSTEKPTASQPQPIVAKLLTNAQGQMISLEGVVGGVRPRPVRLLSPAARLPRPLLLTAHKPLQNIILQQSDGTAIRVTSSGGITSSQSIVLSNLAAQTITTSTTSPPVLKLQQAVSSASASTHSGVRSVLMDGQQLKLVGGRHVLARILRPAHPPQ